jgi:hypothetical protein
MTSAATMRAISHEQRVALAGAITDLLAPFLVGESASSQRMELVLSAVSDC